MLTEVWLELKLVQAVPGEEARTAQLESVAGLLVQAGPVHTRYGAR